MLLTFKLIDSFSEFSKQSCLVIRSTNQTLYPRGEPRGGRADTPVA